MLATVKSATSRYKSCQANGGTYFPFSDGAVIASFRKVDALKDTEPDIVRNLTSLGERELSCIRCYPTIVAMRNARYGTTTPGSILYYGFINSIQMSETSVVFGFTKLHDIPQAIFVDNAVGFGIGKACAYNEFDHPHWSVKHINVVDALRSQGVQVIVFSY